MDVVLICLISAAVLVVAALFFVSRRSKSPEPDKVNGNGNTVEPPQQLSGRDRTAQSRMQAAAALRARRRQRNDPDWDPDNPDEIGCIIEEAAAALPEGKIGAKKLRKLEEKAERAARAEEAKRQQQEKEERIEQRRMEEQEKEAVREAQAAKLAEEEKKRKEEQERKELEEYERLKASFSVEEAGEDATNEEEAQNLLEMFITFIKEQKVVMLEDLAAHFNLKTQDAIARLKDLIAEKRISGLLDDRGKFIYITEEEYRSVAKYIEQQGRVSIADLALAATDLLHLA